MFDNQRNREVPGDDSHGPALPPMPSLPPLREFHVRRYDGEIVEVIVEAHIAGIHADGSVLRFVEFVLDPAVGPRELEKRVFHGWEEYWEVARVPSLIVPAGGLHQ